MGINVNVYGKGFDIWVVMCDLLILLVVCRKVFLEIKGILDINFE